MMSLKGIVTSSFLVIFLALGSAYGQNQVKTIDPAVPLNFPSITNQLWTVNFHAKEYQLQMETFVSSVAPPYTVDEDYLSDYEVERYQSYLNDFVSRLSDEIFNDHDIIVAVLDSEGFDDLIEGFEDSMILLQEILFDALDAIDETEVEQIPLLVLMDEIDIALGIYADEADLLREELL